MRRLELTLAAFMTLASSFPLGAEPAPSAEDVVSRLTGDVTDEQREVWFNSNAKGKVVAWVAPVFNVTPAFDVVLVNIKVSDRGLIGCNVPDRFKEKASAVTAGEPVLCAGRIEGYERLMGAAIVNVIADDFVVGTKSIDAWKKSHEKGNQ